jgi:hypothetical protein
MPASQPAQLLQHGPPFLAVGNSNDFQHECINKAGRLTLRLFYWLAAISYTNGVDRMQMRVTYRLGSF